jgi:hypothetical protein
MRCPQRRSSDCPIGILTYWRIFGQYDDPMYRASGHWTGYILGGIYSGSCADQSATSILAYIRIFGQCSDQKGKASTQAPFLAGNILAHALYSIWQLSADDPTGILIPDYLANMAIQGAKLLGRCHLNILAHALSMAAINCWAPPVI